MGFSVSLGCTVLCFIVTEVVSYDPWDFSARNLNVWKPSARTVPPARQPYGPSLPRANAWAEVDVSQPRALSDLTPVQVKCGEAQVVVTVNRDLFGTGRLVQAADLTLGSPGCEYTSVDDATETVLFEAGLHECGSTLQMTPDSLIYSTTLYYKPEPRSNSLIVRTSPIEVPIECHYPRRDNVSSKAIKPTWVPFSSTISAEERLTFSLRLMNGSTCVPDDWSDERPSNRYHLGDMMHIQADVNTENHVALRLFIDNCVATPSPGMDSTQYALIDYKGCLVDGRSDDSSSAFISPRPKQDTLQFIVNAFRFAEDPQDLPNICWPYRYTSPAILESQQLTKPQIHQTKRVPSTKQEICKWSPVEGTRDICSCCETRNCGSVGGFSRRVNPSWRRPGRLFQRDLSSSYGDSSKVEAEADVVMGPLFIPDVSTVSRSALEDVMAKTNVQVLLWVTGTAAVLSFVSVILGFLLACKKRNNSAV
ncbi:hypothetical protein lerEdw1_008400 [Lerista edwardsae]|nr:hypothetical protein lerEdw1_008400 [Lerista edwardsae]